MQMEKCNQDIRNLIAKEGLKYWIVADGLGVNDTTFSKWLRKELDPLKKKEIREVIRKIKRNSKAENNK